MLKKMLLPFALLMCSMNAFAELAVIVHPSVADTLDTATIAKIFLGKNKSFPSGTSVTPVNIKAGEPLRKEFDKVVLKKTASQIKSYWSKQLFTGKGKPPKEEANSEAILSLVKTNPTMIGYIDSSKVTNDVKVIATF